jgi:glycosyltransferase involved in cell wall biosynthesis
VYNGERFIESCLQAVINQNCKSVEHIIVDGGSSDRTIELVQQYAEKYSHIRWISEKDRGQSDAMNKGIQLAKGEILNVLNVDDYYEPNVLNRILELFQGLPDPSFLVGNCNVWDDSGNLKKFNQPKKLKLTDLLLGADINPHPINPSAYFYHASLHQSVGLYSIDEHYAMDIDFILRAAQVIQINYADETWGNYREISGTKTVVDWASGQGEQRAQQLLAKYRQQLPILARIQVITLATLFKAVKSTTRLLKKVAIKILRPRLNSPLSQP